MIISKKFGWALFALAGAWAHAADPDDAAPLRYGISERYRACMEVVAIKER